MKIWVCYTEHRNGDIDFSAHHTEEGATKSLHDWIIGECKEHGVEPPDLQDKDAIGEWLSEREHTCWVAPCQLKED